MEILNLLDDHSRLCVASDALTVFKATDVADTFTKAAAQYGDPAGMLSDNGAVFTGRPRGGGRVALEVVLIGRGQCRLVRLRARRRSVRLGRYIEFLGAGVSSWSCRRHSSV